PLQPMVRQVIHGPRLLPWLTTWMTGAAHTGHVVLSGTILPYCGRGYVTSQLGQPEQPTKRLPALLRRMMSAWPLLWHVPSVFLASSALRMPPPMASRFSSRVLTT